MDENQIEDFSWSGMFTVTSMSSFLFTGVIWVLDGNISFLFMALGITTFVLSILNWLVRIIKAPVREKKEPDYGYYELTNE